jgi:hypothetical protein
MASITMPIRVFRTLHAAGLANNGASRREPYPKEKKNTKLANTAPAEK